MGIDWGRALMSGTSGAVAGRRELAIAERLKMEAEARDLAMRQTLAQGGYSNQRRLEEMRNTAADARQATVNETALEKERLALENSAIGDAVSSGIYDPGRSYADRLLATARENARRQGITEAQKKAESDSLVGSRNRSNRERPTKEAMPTVEFRTVGDSLLAMTKNPDGSWSSETVDVPGGGQPKDKGAAFKEYQRAIRDEVDLLYKDYRLRLDNGLIDPEEFPSNAEIVNAATETVKERMDIAAGGRTAVLSPRVSTGGVAGLGISEAEALAMWNDTGQ